jgi:hypothetical protein
LVPSLSLSLQPFKRSLFYNHVILLISRSRFCIWAKTWYLSLWAWLQSLSMMISSSMYLTIENFLNGKKKSYSSYIGIFNYFTSLISNRNTRGMSWWDDILKVLGIWWLSTMSFQSNSTMLHKWKILLLSDQENQKEFIPGIHTCSTTWISHSQMEGY